MVWKGWILTKSLVPWIELKKSKLRFDHYFDVVTSVVRMVTMRDTLCWIYPIGAVALALKLPKTLGMGMVGIGNLSYSWCEVEYYVPYGGVGALYFVEVDVELPEELPLIELRIVANQPNQD